jgi:2-phospho-L-lactate transferase/gluconeogenesis factor (CofD/UPF0052 family)
MKKINVVLFSGGRGAATIAKALNAHQQIELSVIVNAYDDGLSTGRIRRFIPGMLGPSDIRKNVSNLMPKADSSEIALATLIEFRLPIGIDLKGGRAYLEIFLGADQSKLNLIEFQELYEKLTIFDVKTLAKWVEIFLEYERQQHVIGNTFDYGDASLGNILFAGCYLSSNSNFNQAIKRFSEFCNLKSKVINVTDGVNKVLVGLKKDGRYLCDESSIVSPQDEVAIEEIFLLNEYLSKEQENELQIKTLPKKLTYLRDLEVYPEISYEAKEMLVEADLIIFGPGTQHSSLLPSYVTRELCETIVGNIKAEKIFISNIAYDHDILNLTVSNLLDSLEKYICRKGSIEIDPSTIISRIFVQGVDLIRVNQNNSAEYLKFDLSHNFRFGGIPITAINWEDESGKHSGGRIVDELLKLARNMIDERLAPYRYKVSIIVPILNEINTIDKVLHDLQSLDMSIMGLSKEIIFIDGGSTDGSFERLKNEDFIRLYQTQSSNLGRGAAIRIGLNNAQGNIIVIFPSDNEYLVTDIYKIIKPILQEDIQIVLGSRLIRCDDINSTLKYIYGKNHLRRFISRLGNLLISMSFLVLYRRYIGDPFTTFKAIDADLIGKMSLISDGVSLDTELIAKSRILGQYILELPVSYFPRQFQKGKKTTVIEGLSALLSTVKFRFWRG